MTGLLGVLPDLPATPASVITAGDWTIDTIAGAVSFLTMIYGTTLFGAIILIASLTLVFEQAYHTVMWVVRKIPIVNIK